MDRFLCDIKTAQSSRREWKVTVAQDYTGLRSLRSIVEQDHVAASMIRMDRRTRIAWSKRHGKTTKETEAKRQRARYAPASERFYGRDGF